MASELLHHVSGMIIVADLLMVDLLIFVFLDVNFAGELLVSDFLFDDVLAVDFVVGGVLGVGLLIVALLLFALLYGRLTPEALIVLRDKADIALRIPDAVVLGCAVVVVLVLQLPDPSQVLCI